MNGPRKLAAILAADVVGYSRLTGLDEEGTLARLREVRRDLIDPAIALHRGRLVKTTGDGVLVEFASVVEAVRCAIDVQRGVATGNKSIAPDRRMEFRIGINVGDVVVEGDDLLGDGVNIAARLEGISDPGGICISESAYHQVRDRLDIGIVDSGEQVLKNIARPMRVYRLQLECARPRPTAALPLPDKPSIAVLAFENLSGDSQQDYFADGVVEDVITALSRFRQLFVIARNSSFAFKGRHVDVKQIGRDLGVRYVLEGSVRKSRDRVRITGQLIDAATGAHLWADRFDGELADIFGLQDQVTTSVVGAIMPRLEEAEIERAMRKPTESLDAYDYYLRALAIVNQQSREANDEALRLFYKAMAIDPNFALAYSWAGRCFVFRRMNGWMTDRASEVTEANRLARRAVALGKDDSIALSNAANVLAYVVGDLDAAASACDRALSLNTNAAVGWGIGGYVKLLLGDPNVGIEHLAVAMRLSPLEPRMFQWQYFTALAHFNADRFDDASSWSERGLREQPDHLGLLRTCAASHAAAGRLEEAQEAMARLRQLHPSLRASNLGDVVPPFSRPEDGRRLVEALRKAGLPD